MGQGRDSALQRSHHCKEKAAVIFPKEQSSRLVTLLSLVIDGGDRVLGNI